MSTSAAPEVKKHHRIFMWFFLAVQALFTLWIILGVSGANPQDDAEAAGTAIGAALVVALWVAADFLLGVTYLIVKVAKK